MRSGSIVVTLLTGAMCLAAGPVAAQTCDQLWVERNQYYKNHGYCFKTQRAISYFGNGGCFIQDQNAVPLTPAERTRIDHIVQQERAMGCSDSGPAPGMTCDQLWIARNAIYKARGYCFKTQRAINYFGNAGCQYDSQNDLPLTRSQRRAVDEIVRIEQAKGCRD